MDTTRNSASTSMNKIHRPDEHLPLKKRRVVISNLEQPPAMETAEGIASGLNSPNANEHHSSVPQNPAAQAITHRPTSPSAYALMNLREHMDNVCLPGTREFNIKNNLTDHEVEALNKILSINPGLKSDKEGGPAQTELSDSHTSVTNVGQENQIQTLNKEQDDWSSALQTLIQKPFLTTEVDELQRSYEGIKIKYPEITPSDILRMYEEAPAPPTKPINYIRKLEKNAHRLVPLGITAHDAISVLKLSGLRAMENLFKYGPRLVKHPFNFSIPNVLNLASCGTQSGSILETIARNGDALINQHAFDFQSLEALVSKPNGLKLLQGYTTFGRLPC